MSARQPLVLLPHPLHAREGLVSVAYVPHASDPALVAANDPGPIVHPSASVAGRHDLEDARAPVQPVP